MRRAAAADRFRRDRRRGQAPLGARAGNAARHQPQYQRAYNELESSGYCCSVPGKGCFAVHTYRAQDDARRLSLEQQIRELLQELRAMGVSEEDIQALCREGEVK